jgi:hypothetical protein
MAALIDYRNKRVAERDVTEPSTISVQGDGLRKRVLRERKRQDVWDFYKASRYESEALAL